MIECQLDSGIVEPVLEAVCAAGQVHYLPYHPVLKESKTKKFVWFLTDAAGPSLNDCLCPCLQ